MGFAVKIKKNSYNNIELIMVINNQPDKKATIIAIAKMILPVSVNVLIGFIWCLF